MEKNPLISIIVPVYKVEKYLDECLESIVNQTYKNLEIILVDDGSPDNSGAMCDDWAKKDNRIIVIHQINQGQSVARNTALYIAKGEFIGFCDSDDFFSLDAIEKLYMNFDNSVGIVSGNFHRYHNGQTFCFDERWELKEKRTIESNDAFLLMFDGVLNHTLQNKLFRRSVIQGIRFPKGRLCEDQWFSIVATMLLIKLNLSLVEIPIVTYFYRYNDSSTTMHQAEKMHLDWKINRIDVLVYGVEQYGMQIDKLPTYINTNDAVNMAIVNWNKEVSIIIRKYLNATKHINLSFDNIHTKVDYIMIKYLSPLIPAYVSIRKCSKNIFKH